ncbi:hypothetical protein [Paenibacillus polymyxa]|uniref:hypothetical protein n=1 Tax=Paenibacillus polymyxa TaxID=1406 RepID=UPI002AB5A906|nr:hypothetical protein [Paenibacillus polymyxa]MDY8021196.1 hypothetical protein [Paenibacillus polymyxa]
MAIIDEETLTKLYKEDKLSDVEIARRYKVDRTWIVHLRKKWMIEKNNDSRQTAFPIIESMLLEKGWKVEFTYSSNEVSILLNGKIKIEIMTSTINQKDKTAHFQLSTKESDGNIENEIRIRLPNGRTRKIFYKTCDYIIFFVFDSPENHIWIFKSDDIPDTLQTLSLFPYSIKSKYDNHKENWDIIKVK